MKTKTLSDKILFIQISKENQHTLGDDFAISDLPLSTVDVKQKPMRMSGLAISICIKGETKLKINTTPFTIKKNDLIVLPPGQVVQLVSRSEDSELHSIYTSESFLSTNSSSRAQNMNVFFTIRDNPCINISDHEAEIFTSYYNLMLSRIKDTNNTHRLDTMRHLFNALLSDMSDIFFKYNDIQKNSISRKDEICKNFMKELTAHYKSNRNVSFYAEKLFITPKYLSNTLKNVTGKKAGQLIDEFVVLQAKILLQSTNLTIQQISEELNFTNQSFFGRYFKRVAGVSPSQYRK